MLRSVAVLHVLKYYLYWISALGVSHVMRSINVRYLLTYLLTYVELWSINFVSG